jgi:hypothetical protein
MGGIFFLTAMLLGGTALICHIWILVLEFRRSVWWGLGGIFLSFPVNLIFVIKYWSESKRPFLIGVGCGVAYMVAALVMKH